MSKKSINKKEVNKTIKDKVNQGVSRIEILNELSEKYFDKKTLSMLIAATPDPTRIEKYKLLNNILLGLIFITIISKILLGFFIFSQISTALIPLAFLFPILNFMFAFEVSKYKGYIYNILGVITVAGIFNVLGKINENIFFGVIDIMIGILIAGLAFYLGNKMFPNYGLIGPKKDSKGEIILE
ncbi:hypothetical protein DWB61_17520 [Ancylomarina euxinus]|uniref:Uncharacterized protein n=1 Tax=Ancylomarina euxinus TaxID=2283627 RepID=A0A425XWD8_9BACT|nr:hypothetical protein [Ancylomarina euxinus]MCZ4696466.1 hypothetical protein [Ancylomarina euxinus]MUP16824.1 hypothetical protein [Ancylomarina euxinus]RRG18953.1 hypothetical protein DWB61_17520 [Ancylomarina euxinus]